MATDQGTTQETADDPLPLGLTAAAVAVAVAVLLPLVWLFRTALGVGVAEAIELLTRPTTVEVFVNSALLVAGVTAGSILLGVPLAYLTVRTDLPFARFWTVAVSLPLVIPSYIGAFAFVSAFGPQGAFQRLLAPLGVESLPEIYGFHGAVLVLTLYTYPYVYITTRAALKSLDTTLIDAARTLRHSRREAFRHVTLPHIRPAVAAGSLLVALYALSDFGTPAIMQFDAFTRVIYVEFNAFGRDTATLLSLQLVEEGVLSMTEMIKKMHTGPADILGIQKGLRVSELADITIIDPEITYHVNAEDFMSLSRNTPFHGWRVKGKAVCTMAQGTIVYADDRIFLEEE